jgi:hypothetical protein
MCNDGCGRSAGRAGYCDECKAFRVDLVRRMMEAPETKPALDAELRKRKRENRAQAAGGK